MENKIESKHYISVVIPTYNRANLIENAISSTLKQTHNSFEVIVVDDASTDNTDKVVRCIQDKRLKYIQHQTNKGGSATRNTGINSALGNYIAFLDDDDEWSEDKLEKQLKAIGDSDAILCGAKKKSSGQTDQRYKKSTINLKDLKKGFVFGAGTSTLLVRSYAIKDILFDEDLPCNQDWDLMMRLAEKYRIAYINEPLVIFNDGTHARITNVSINRPIEELEDRFKAVYKHKEKLGKFWVNYHIARRLLYYLRRRDNMMEHLIYTIKRCGVLAVIMVYLQRTKMKIFKSA